MIGNSLHRSIVLTLNRCWVPLGTLTPEVALKNLFKGTVKGMDIEYGRLETGELDLSAPLKIQPTDWPEWAKLNVRDYDLFIQTSRISIRVPTVVICSEYGKIPSKKLKMNAQNAYDRFQGICAYSGKKLTRKRATLDHVTPRSRGGKNDWSNIVLCDRDINFMKADRTPEEAGLKLLYRPSVPGAVPAVIAIKEMRHQDWSLFMMHGKNVETT